MVNFPLEVTVATRLKNLSSVTVIVLEDLFKFLACKQHKELSKQTVGKMFSLNEFFLVHWLMYYSHFLNLTLWQQECKLNNMRLFSYRFFFFGIFWLGGFLPLPFHTFPFMMHECTVKVNIFVQAKVTITKCQ